MKNVRRVRLVQRQGMGERLMVVVCEPFVEVIGKIVRERIGSGIFKVHDDEGVVRGSRRGGRLVEDEEVAVF
jgi:hypothetical protein